MRCCSTVTVVTPLWPWPAARTSTPAVRRSPPWPAVLVVALAAGCAVLPGVLPRAEARPLTALDMLEGGHPPGAQAAASRLVPPIDPPAARPAEAGQAPPVGCQPWPAQEPVSLRLAVQRALCLDPRTRASWAEVAAEAAQRLSVQAESAPRGSLQAQAGVRQLRLREPGEPLARTDGASRGLGAELSWTLADFGQSRLRAEAADLAVRSAIRSHDELVQNLILEVVQLHQAAVQAQAELALQRQAERLLRDLLAEAQRPKRPGGSLDSLSERQARTELARLTIDLRRADAEWARARGALALRLGLPPTVPIALPAPAPAAEAVDQARDWLGLVGEAMQAHPALRAAQARAQGAEAALALARREDLPVIELRAAWQRGREPGTGRLTERAAGLTLTVPLAPVAERRGRVQRAEARLAQARAEVDQQRQDTALAVWTSYQTLREEAAALEMAARYRREAEALLAAELQAFREGEADMFDVLDAHGSVREAESGLLAGRAALTVARVRLAAALGRLGLDTLAAPDFP